LLKKRREKVIETLVIISTAISITMAASQKREDERIVNESPLNFYIRGNIRR
jgi:hypothetical protein